MEASARIGNDLYTRLTNSNLNIEQTYGSYKHEFDRFCILG